MTRRPFYMVGDEVSVYVAIEHMSNLMSVDLVYVLGIVGEEDTGVTLTLTGTPQEIIEDNVPPTGWRRFKAEALAEVELKHPSGEYFLDRIELYTAGGQTFVYDPADHATVKSDHYTLEVSQEESITQIYLSLEAEEDRGSK